MARFTDLAIRDPKNLYFGTSPKPLKTRSGLLIGGGTVYPELNFTLPPMILNDETYPKVRNHYEQIVQGAMKRAVDLEAPGVVLEFETLPPMTHNPDWGAELCKILLDGMAEAEAKYTIKTALRMTPNDNREMVRPPVMRSGIYWENMLETFERSAALGADLLSIESVGGKEIHDEALTMCDIRQVIFALCVMGERDMRFLWTHIADIAKRHGVHAAGDTACGFGNTAMVLAEKGMIPRVFAAVVRAITAVRSLVAYECGAVGPGKDCGYENPFLKAITGFPMSIEGKTAACAHFSPMGNIAAATCDLWSNESVQNLMLLAGMAPTCYMEQLEYDCRLYNQAAKEGTHGILKLQEWLVKSDAHLDPQAYILAPENVIRIANAIVSQPTAYQSGIAAAHETIALLREGCDAGLVKILDREAPYLDMIEFSLSELPDDEESFISSMMMEVNTSNFIPAEYDLV